MTAGTHVDLNNIQFSFFAQGGGGGGGKMRLCGLLGGPSMYPCAKHMAN